MEDFNLALQRFSASMVYRNGGKYGRVLSPKKTYQECDCSFCLPAVFHSRARIIQSPKQPANILEESQRITVLPPPLISTSPVERMFLYKDQVTYGLHVSTNPTQLKTAHLQNENDVIVKATNSQKQIKITHAQYDSAEASVQLTKDTELTRTIDTSVEYAHAQKDKDSKTTHALFNSHSQMIHGKFNQEEHTHYKESNTTHARYVNDVKAVNRTSQLFGMSCGAKKPNHVYTLPDDRNSHTELPRYQTIQTPDTNSICKDHSLSQESTYSDDYGSFKSISRAQSIQTDSNTKSLSQEYTHPDNDEAFTSGLSHKPFALKETKDRDSQLGEGKMTHVQYKQDSSCIKDARTITIEQYEYLKNCTNAHALYNLKDLKDTKLTDAQFEVEKHRSVTLATKVQGNRNETKSTHATKKGPLSKKKVTCICSFCSKSFATTRALELHVRRHSGLRPYPCKFCDKSFYQPSERAVHMRTHTGARPYRCPYCLKLFRYSGDLKQHINIHTGQRPYQCETCSKAFTNHSTLRQHKRIHSGERPYLCKDCGKTYRYHSSLKQHRTAHQKKAALQALNMTSSKSASRGNVVKVKKEK